MAQPIDIHHIKWNAIAEAFSIWNKQKWEIFRWPQSRCAFYFDKMTIDDDDWMRIWKRQKNIRANKFDRVELIFFIIIIHNCAHLYWRPWSIQALCLSCLNLMCSGDTREAIARFLGNRKILIGKWITKITICLIGCVATIESLGCCRCCCWCCCTPNECYWCSKKPFKRTKKRRWKETVASRMISTWLHEPWQPIGGRKVCGLVEWFLIISRMCMLSSGVASTKSEIIEFIKFQSFLCSIAGNDKAATIYINAINRSRNCCVGDVVASSASFTSAIIRNCGICNRNASLLFFSLFSNKWTKKWHQIENMFCDRQSAHTHAISKRRVNARIHSKNHRTVKWIGMVRASLSEMCVCAEIEWNVCKQRRST